MIVGEFYRPAVQPGDRSDQRQAEPRPAFVPRRIEPAEALQRSHPAIRRNTGSVVADDDRDAAAFVLYRQPDGSCTIFQRVIDQV
ncbi:unnamed protein product [Sordaria macrospora k-hell]|uniref:WGS project CABT00000000 data, contig 2.592 n=1 Tax=Sordaria macrospora (strain ATCC MYA-333 / DSM 997 / K(L3346) / K-hell) TaxID=771870 RepID=F7WD07_SORMK|nr:unnamed protein product [Sordaria macrospora k-hell]